MKEIIFEWLDTLLCFGDLLDAKRESEDYL